MKWNIVQDLWDISNLFTFSHRFEHHRAKKHPQPLQEQEMETKMMEEVKKSVLPAMQIKLQMP